MSLDRKSAHAALTTAAAPVSRQDFEVLAHDIVDNLCDVIDAIAKQVAEQTAAGILAQRRQGTTFVTADGKVHRPGPDCPACTAPSTSSVPSRETEAELVEARKVKAIEALALALTIIANKDSEP